MQMNGQNPDSLLMEDPVRSYLIDCVREVSSRNDDRISLAEFRKLLNKLDLGFDKTEVDNLFSNADSESSGAVDIFNVLNAVTNQRSSELTFRVLFTRLADELGISVGYSSSSSRRKIYHRQQVLNV